MDEKCKTCMYAERAFEKAMEASELHKEAVADIRNVEERVRVLEQTEASQVVINKSIEKIEKSVEDIKSIPGKIMFSVTVPMIVTALVTLWTALR